MATLAEMRAKLLAQENKKENNNNTSRGPSPVYPFWNLDNDETATLRFLPDADESNSFFWRERQIIKIPFSGVKGVDGWENKPVTIQVPCVEMWGDTCPVHAEIRPWFKDPSMEDLARTYWKKRSYIFQGFVVNSPMSEDETPENPIRRFIIGPQIFKLLKAALMDPDMENMPTDFDAGTDFRLTKTQKGQYADYSTSNWARKERSLNEAERDAIETHGLADLNEAMPKRPNDDELRAITEMFEASVDGELYDPAQWANFYRPYGVDLSDYIDGNGSSESTTESAPKAAPKPAAKPAAKVEADEDDAPFDADPAPAAEEKKGSADDILAMIRKRKAEA